MDRLDPLLVGQVVTLLGWDEATTLARASLAGAAGQICGQLVDNLLDQTQDFAVRRRLPGILVHAGSQRAVDGLMLGLADARFEVRFQCGRALASIAVSHADLKIGRDAVLGVVDRELSVSRSVWNGHRLLDRRDASEQTQFLDDVLRERADASLEHVFTLLGLVLPRDPLKVAFRALHTDDRLLRGLALEYLETALPDHIRGKLARIVEEAPRSQPRRSSEEILASLMQSNQSVVLRIQEKLGPHGG
jgi:AAA family ATP:ADP antiporter